MENYNLCIYLAKCYEVGSCDPNDLNKIDYDIHPMNFEGSDIPWFKVGRNSYHDFYLGLDKSGNLYKREYWCDYINEEMVESNLVIPITSDNIGYIGHF